MQTSGLPTRIAVPFADAGTKNTIPVDSQIGITGGAASFTTGFPPLTMTPVSAGGIPPFGADFNGILNAITNAIRWNVAGSGYPFDSTFATAVTGYPKGALLPASDFSGYWLNTQEANTTNPENSTAATTGWVPGVHYGATALTGLSSSSVTLTTLQAAKPRINLSGTLTANINLVFPAWVRTWTVVNNCTGAFSVTCKTPSGSGVVIASGVTAVINGDGTNISQDTNFLQASKNLSDVASAATSLANLGGAALAGSSSQAFSVATATASAHAVPLTQMNTALNLKTSTSSFSSTSNANGAYYSYPGGLQICRGNITIAANSSATWTYPLSFASNPQIFYTALIPGGSGTTLAMWINSISTGSVSIYNPNSVASQINLLGIL